MFEWALIWEGEHRAGHAGVGSPGKIISPVTEGPPVAWVSIWKSQEVLGWEGGHQSGEPRKEVSLSGFTGWEGAFLLNSAGRGVPEEPDGVILEIFYLILLLGQCWPHRIRTGSFDFYFLASMRIGIISSLTIT